MSFSKNTKRIVQINDRLNYLIIPLYHSDNNIKIAHLSNDNENYLVSSNINARNAVNKLMVQLIDNDNQLKIINEFIKIDTELMTMINLYIEFDDIESKYKNNSMNVVEYSKQKQKIIKTSKKHTHDLYKIEKQIGKISHQINLLNDIKSNKKQCIIS